MPFRLKTVLAVMLVAFQLHAQVVTMPVPKPRTEQQPPTLVRSSREIVEDLKAALRDMITAQEMYFAAHDSYTTDARALDVFPVKHGQAQTEVIFASREAWSGRATEPSWKGKSCVTFVGSVKSLPDGVPRTAFAGTPAKLEAEPVCDEAADDPVRAVPAKMR